MEPNPLEDLTHRIRLSRHHKSAIARELASHVAEARRDLVLSGWNADDAGREALARLGEPDELADAFTRAHRPSHRNQFGMALALAIGMILGVYGIGGSFASATAVHAGHHHASIAHDRPHREQP